MRHRNSVRQDSWPTVGWRPTAKDTGHRIGGVNPMDADEFMSGFRAAGAPGAPLVKLCAGCKLGLPVERFSSSKTNSDGLQNYCRSCANGRAQVQGHQDFDRDLYLQKVESQGGVCAICRTNVGNKSLAIDHRHGCGCEAAGYKSCRKCRRALLCTSCNTALGSFRDDPTILARAIVYLNEWNQ